MSSALSSIVRTRQKKTFFSLFFLILLLSPLSPPSGVQAAESSASSVASPNSIGRAASEEKNVDSFSVHPANRWTVANVGYTAAINDGLLNMSDVGDSSSDYYVVSRDLRDLSGTVEIRFKYSSNSTGTATANYAEIYLYDGTATNSFLLKIQKLRDGLAGDTILYYYDVDASYQSLFLPTAEDLIEDTWYIIRMDYDLLESDFRIRVFSDVGVEVFDYVWQDIGTTRPAIFSDSSLLVRLKAGCYYPAQSQFVYFDYVNAPFKEREWTNTDVPGDGDWITNGKFLSYIQDDINDASDWQLTVPYLDQVSGYG